MTLRPGSLRIALLLAGLLPGLALSAPLPDLPSPITPAGIAALVRVSDARLSPDGRLVAYSTSGPDAPDRPGESRLWLVRTDPGPVAPPIAVPGAEPGDHAPVWSPDGCRLAFLGGHGGPVRIWLLDPSSGTVRGLPALPGDATAFRFSPDGRRIAAVVRVPGARTGARGAVEAGSDDGSSRLYLQDVADGRASPVGDPRRFVFDVEWSPDGQALAIRFGDRPGLDYVWYRARVAVIDTAGHQRVLLPHQATAMHPRFSPDGSSLVYGVFAPDGINGRVLRQDLAGGDPVVLGGGWDGAIRDIAWNADGRTLIGLAQSGLSPELVRIDAATGRVIPGAVPDAVLGGEPFELSASRDGRVAVVASTADRPDEVWLFDGKTRRRLSDSNPGVAGWRLGAQRAVSWHSHRDGTLLQGLLVLPPDAKPGVRLPLVVQIHGGPLEAWAQGWRASWHDWARLLAAHGYAVFMPNPRGSEGRGEAFADAVRHDWGGVDFDDIEDGVDSLEHDGIADPSRELIAGWSYGGFMSAWAAGHTRRYRAAIDGAGPTDLATMSLTTDVGFSFLTPYFGDPIADRALYDAHSPLDAVQQVRMPVLILQGGADARVPPSQAEMFFHALQDQGSPVRFVRYPGAPHWFGGTVGADTQIDVQTRVLDWVRQHLGCAEAACAK